MELQHWLALLAIPLLIVGFFAATVEKRLRGDVALVIALVIAILVGWYLLQKST